MLFLSLTFASYLDAPTAYAASEAVVEIELDGEQPGTTPVRFEIVPGALRLRVPAA